MWALEQFYFVRFLHRKGISWCLGFTTKWFALVRSYEVTRTRCHRAFRRGYIPVEVLELLVCKKSWTAVLELFSAK